MNKKLDVPTIKLAFDLLHCNVIIEQSNEEPFLVTIKVHDIRANGDEVQPIGYIIGDNILRFFPRY